MSAYPPQSVGPLVEDLVKAREPYEPGWRETDRIICPGTLRLDASDTNRGDVDDSEIVNSTADQAQETYENGMLAFAVNPSQPWVRPEPEDPTLARRASIARWCDDVAQEMLDATEEAGVYDQFQAVFGNAGKFANSCLWAEESYKTIVRAKSLAVGSWWVGKDPDGIPNSIFRRFQTSVRNAVESFADRGRSGKPDLSNFSSEAGRAYNEKKPQTPIEIGHLVVPNEGYRPGSPFSDDMPWKSCYFEVAGDARAGDAGGRWAPAGGKLLREGGYEEFPGLFFPWHIQGDDVYGVRCPARLCRSDVRELQYWAVKRGAAADKLLDPPLYGPGWAKTLKVGYLPGQVTAVGDVDLSKGGLRRVVEGVDSKTLEAMSITQEIVDRIKQAYHVPLFRMLETLDMKTARTATEIAARQQESLMQLVGVMTRLTRGLLIPYVERLFTYMIRQGRIVPPRELQGERLKLKFVSPMAMAMRALNLNAIDRVLETAILIAKAEPTVMRNLSLRNVLEEKQRASGAPARILRTEEELAAMDEADRQAAAAQAQAEQLAQLARGAKDLSQTKTDEKNALTDVVAGLTAAGGRAA